MRKPILAAALLVSGAGLFLGLACQKPDAAPKPANSKVDDSDARAREEAEARRRAEEEARRKREAQSQAEQARLADQEKAKAFQRAADAALKDIHFDYDMSDIKPAAKATLQGIADFLKAYPQVGLLVEGHCDERGTVEYNIALGDRRAASAVDYLVGLGTARGRFSTVSYGKERPLCSEPAESCWSRNRRAHFGVKY